MKTSKKKTKAVKHPKRSRTSKHKKPGKVARAPQYPWESTTNYACVISRSGKQKLGLFVMGNPVDGFAAAAISVQGEIGALQDVFDHHTHHIIGEDFKSAHVAMSAAEEYGGKWARRELTEVEECACEDIESAIGSAIHKGATDPAWSPPVPEVAPVKLYHPPPPLSIMVDDGTLPKIYSEVMPILIDPLGNVLKNRFGETTREAIGAPIIDIVLAQYKQHLHAQVPS